MQSIFPQFTHTLDLWRELDTHYRSFSKWHPWTITKTSSEVFYPLLSKWSSRYIGDLTQPIKYTKQRFKPAAHCDNVDFVHVTYDPVSIGNWLQTLPERLTGMPARDTAKHLAMVKQYIDTHDTDTVWLKNLAQLPLSSDSVVLTLWRSLDNRCEAQLCMLN
jgi:hypothetical protein